MAVTLPAESAAKAIYITLIVSSGAVYVSVSVLLY